MVDIVPIGSLPAPGDVPARMHAQVVRTERLGEPRDAFRSEEIEVPRPGPGEVLVAVMAAGVNFNNVWAARGIPINVIADRQRQDEPYDFHIGGSDASGIVWALGEGVDTTAVMAFPSPLERTRAACAGTGERGMFGFLTAAASET